MRPDYDPVATLISLPAVRTARFEPKRPSAKQKAGHSPAFVIFTVGPKPDHVAQPSYFDFFFAALDFFFTFLIAVRTAVRRLMLCTRRPCAWCARLRADFVLAMDSMPSEGAGV